MNNVLRSAAINGVCVLLLASCSSASLTPSTVVSAHDAKTHPAHHGLGIDASVDVHPSQSWGPNNPNVMGGDLINDVDFSQSWVKSALRTIGFTALRDPQGSVANVYLWSTNLTPSQNPCYMAIQQADRVEAALDLAGSNPLHTVVNAGSDSDCDANTPGSSTDAASWLTYLLTTKGCPLSQCGRVTISNEFYTAHEIDRGCMGSYPNDAGDPACAGPIFSSFITALHGVSTGINVCVQADPQQDGPYGPSWDSKIFTLAGYSCVDAHYYVFPANKGKENDATLLNAPVNDFTNVFLRQLKSDIGGRGVQIVIGEYGSVPSGYTVESESIVQALFDGELIGEMLQDGVVMAHRHTTLSNCTVPVRDTNSQVYGQWLQFSGAMAVSNGSAGSCAPPAVGTILPGGDALEVASHFVKSGETIVKNTVADGSTGDVSCYSTTLTGSYGLMCFNRSSVNSFSLAITVDGKTSGSGGTGYYYDKAIFDLTKGSKWNPPSPFTVPSWSPPSPLHVTLTPWSITFIPLG